MFQIPLTTAQTENHRLLAQVLCSSEHPRHDVDQRVPSSRDQVALEEEPVHGRRERSDRGNGPSTAPMHRAFSELPLTDAISDPLIGLLNEADNVDARSFAQLLQSASRVLEFRSIARSQ